MPKTYSQDLRARVLAAADRGMKTGQIASTFQVCSSWVRRVKQRRRECGETAARRRGGGAEIKVDRVRLAELVREDPDATLVELRERLGVGCAISTICMALKRLGFSFKKKRCMRRSSLGRMSSRSVSSGVSGRSTSRRSD
jgi:transposase